MACVIHELIAVSIQFSFFITFPLVVSGLLIDFLSKTLKIIEAMSLLYPSYSGLLVNLNAGSRNTLPEPVLPVKYLYAYSLHYK